MDIIEWFDPQNLEHVKAYKHLMDKGFWPKGFIPSEIEFFSTWQAGLAFKIARQYVIEKLK